jgi:hypothetical protein
MFTRRLLFKSGLALAAMPALARTAGAQASKLDFAFVGHEL